MNISRKRFVILFLISAFAFLFITNALYGSSVRLFPQPSEPWFGTESQVAWKIVVSTILLPIKIVLIGPMIPFINFVEYFRAKYEKKYSEKWPDPFGNVPNTISAWRDSILNYIDCKPLFKGKTVSNSFAEFTNGQIRKAYRIGNNFSYEVLRLKVIYGGVMTRRRPPHPLDEKHFRVTKGRTRRGKKKHQEKNPNANLEILKKAREDSDETRDLLPNPQANPDWASRFDSTDRSKLYSVVKEEVSDPEMTDQLHREEEDQKLKTQISRVHPPFRHNPDQRKLF